MTPKSRITASGLILTGLLSVNPLPLSIPHTATAETPTPSTTEAKVKAIIVEHLSVTPEQLTPDADFVEALGADSLSLTALTIAVEEAFGFTIPDENIATLTTVGSLVAYVGQHAKQ